MPVSNKQKVAGGAGLIALVGSAAAALLMAEIPKDEGVVLRGYLDPANIPTKCMGDTYDVVLGKRYTPAECNASMMKQLTIHAAPVMKCAPSIKGNAYVTYASVSYAYNAGPGRFCRNVAPLFQAGKWKAACNAMSAPTTSRGVVYPGLVKRRKKEVAACLAGVS